MRIYIKLCKQPSFPYYLHYPTPLNKYDASFQFVTKNTKPISMDREGNKSLLEDELKLPTEYQRNIYKSREFHNDPIRAAVDKLRGVSAIILKYQNITKLFSQESKIYECDYFKLYFYPVGHFLTIFRKSKPSLNIKPFSSSVFNSSFPLKDSKLGKVRSQTQEGLFFKKYDNIFKNYSSPFPKDHEYLRRSLRQSIRKTFIEEWCALGGDKGVKETIIFENDDVGSITGAKHKWKYLDKYGIPLPGIAKDGFYQYHINKFADENTQEDFKNCVKESVRTVANVSMSDFLLSKSRNREQSWVDKANSTVNIQSLNRILKSSEAPTLEKISNCK